MTVNSSRTLREAVRTAYSAAADHPLKKHAFPVGRSFAESIGYPADLLEKLPSVSSDAFAGVSCVSMFADIQPGHRVLDLGCGAGLDSLIAAGRVGPTGHVTGVDFSETMLTRARRATVEIGLDNLDFHEAEAESLPFDDATFDVVIANGIFNLNPLRTAIFTEMSRVLSAGGTAWAAELILTASMAPTANSEPSNWFAWVAGAKEGGAFLEEFTTSGFSSAEILRATQNARTRNPKVIAAEVMAVRSSDASNASAKR